MTETAFETVRFEATNYDDHCSSLTCDVCGSLNKALAELEQQVERARVVGVLDAEYARNLDSLEHPICAELSTDGRWFVNYNGTHWGDDADAARAAAAKAIEAGEV